MASGAPKNSSFEPSSLLAVAGFGLAVYGGYESFQKDTTADVAALTTRVAVLESQMADFRGGK